MADRPHKILAHGDPQLLVPGLWIVRGSLPIPLMRNMTVYRLMDRTLLLHSVVAMNDGGMAKLDVLGKPSILIVPSGGHRMDVKFYKARYPDIRVVCPEGARAKVQKVIAVDATCEEALPPLGVRLHPMTGYKTGELVYEVDVPGGKALMATDAFANRDHPPGLGGLFTANVTGGIKGRLGVPRIVRFLLMKDKAAARAALSRLAEIPDVKVVVPAHGRPVLDDCAGALREAAASLH